MHFVFLLLFFAFNIVWAQGNITYSLQKVSNPTEDQLDAYSRIETAMDSAVALYNKYTSLSKNIKVYYDTGVPTAQANFDGVISFGSSRSYMVVITAMHEMGHVFGVGTTSEYKNAIVDRVFTGTKATAKIKELTGDSNAKIEGDATHFWPYGLNYANEVKSEEDLIRHCFIIDAIYKDLFKEELIFTGKIKADNGLCMAKLGNSLRLSDCNDQGAIVKVIQLGEAVSFTYRLEFDNVVLDIPNETTQPNTEVGLYQWNGKNHQKVVFDTASDNRISIKMNHANLFLEAQTDRIFQVIENNSSDSQKWTFISLDEDPLILVQKTNYKDVIQGKADFKYIDLKGRMIRSQKIKRNQKVLKYR